MSEMQVSINLLITFIIFLISLGLMFFHTREIREQGSFKEENMVRYVRFLTNNKPEKAQKIKANLKYKSRAYLTQLAFYMAVTFACLIMSLIMMFSALTKLIKIIGSDALGYSLVKLYTEGGLAELALTITFMFGATIFQTLYVIARRNCIFSLDEGNRAVKE